MLISGVRLLHDNARIHTTRLTVELLEVFSWDVLAHLQHSSNLVPSDYKN